MKLMGIWVKSPFLKAASLLIAGECVQAIYHSVYKKFSKGKVTLTTCPEAEGSAFMGKLASIITCSVPKDLTILTVDGFPHCFTPHAAANEALFIKKPDFPCRHCYR